MGYNFGRGHRRFTDAEAEAILLDLFAGKKTPQNLARDYLLDPTIFWQMARGLSYADIRPDLQRWPKAPPRRKQKPKTDYAKAILRDQAAHRAAERRRERLADARLEAERAELRRRLREEAAARAGSGTP